MRHSSILVSIAALLPLACSNGGAADAGNNGICGGSQSTCADITDCCTGFECEGGKCVFVGGGNGGNGGSSSESGSSGSGSSGSHGTSGSGSSGGTTVQSSTGFGSSGQGSTGLGSTGQGSTGFGSTGQGSTGFGGSTGAGSTGFGGSTGAGSSSGSASGCKPWSGNPVPTYDAACNPNGGTSKVCAPNGLCIANCNSASNVCTTLQVCEVNGHCEASGGSSSGGSSSGGGSSGGSSGSASGLCAVCAVYPTTTTPDTCTGGTSLCACDPDDPSCNDGFCAASCDVGDAGDQALCPSGTTCLQTTDWVTETLVYFVCYPDDGTCLDAGV